MNSLRQGPHLRGILRGVRFERPTMPIEEASGIPGSHVSWPRGEATLGIGLGLLGYSRFLGINWMPAASSAGLGRTGIRAYEAWHTCVEEVLSM